MRTAAPQNSSCSHATADARLALVWQIVEHQPPALPSETPPDMVEIIRGLLQKDPHWPQSPRDIYG